MLEARQKLIKWAEDNKDITFLSILDGYERAVNRKDKPVEIVLTIMDSEEKPGFYSKDPEKFKANLSAWTQELVHLTGLSNIVLYSTGSPGAVNRHMERIYGRLRSPEEIQKRTN